MSAVPRSIDTDPISVLETLQEGFPVRHVFFVFFDPAENAYLRDKEQIINVPSNREEHLPFFETDTPFRRLLDQCVKQGEPERRSVRTGAFEGVAAGVPLAVNQQVIGTAVLTVDAEDDAEELDTEAVQQHLAAHPFAFARAWMFYASKSHFDHPFLVGNTEEWRKVEEHLMSAAGYDHNEMPVYILGEPGTGKEFAARFIHFLSGRAREGELVSMNCPTIEDTLAGTELFGHEKGAFTGAHSDREGAFERADGGTLFLDEIADLSDRNQKRILRAVEYGQIKRIGGDREIEMDVRVICATKKKLEEEVRRGRFREDLYARLRTVKIELPPLRNWKETIPDLVEIYNRRQREIGGPARSFTDGAKEAMKKHDYPANCRELKNIVSEIGVRFSEDPITATEVNRFFSGYTSPVMHDAPSGDETGTASADRDLLDWTRPPKDARSAFERHRLEQALEATTGDVEKIADTRDVSLKAIYKRCGKHDLEPADFRP